jgi:predicted secreted protein
MTIPVAAMLSLGCTQAPQDSRRSASDGVTFGDANQDLGGARTADLDGGGMLGVRAPLRDTGTPVVRPYVLVDDISAAVSAASEAGAEIAIMPTEIARFETELTEEEVIGVADYSNSCRT